MSRKDQRRELIQMATLKVIARHGMKKTTMEDIAYAAGMRAASIYYYYKNKEEVFAAAIHAMTETYIRQLEEEVARVGSAEEKLTKFLEVRQAFSKGVSEQYPTSADIIFELMPLVLDKLEDARASELRVLQEILERGVADGSFDIDDIGVTARTLRACQDRTNQPAVPDELPDELDFTTLVRILVRGISKGKTNPIASADEEGR